MELSVYSSELKPEWNGMVSRSKNATFLLHRDYMEYHSDRFRDFSLVFTSHDGEVRGLLPANISGDTLVSHGGLTYGGLVMDDKTSGIDPIGMFDVMRRDLPRMGIRRLVYKPVPWIYHRHPAEEDLYALFRNGARLVVRNLATVVDLESPIPSSRLWKRAAKRRRQGCIDVVEVDSPAEFWEIIVEDRRVRHNAVPVHTYDEMARLKAMFPDKIRCMAAYGPCGDVLAGAVIYADRGVLHLQYAAATSAGKGLYATDVIYHDVVSGRFPGARFFDFGTSNEDGGRYLNAGMVAHKEEFGGRSVVYDTYELEF